MPSVKFVVKDYAGKPHEYETTLVPSSLGCDIHRQLMACVAEPVLVAVYELMRTANADLAAKAAKQATKEGVVDAISLMEGVDAGRIGAAARTALNSLPTQLVRMILSMTSRDMVPLRMDAAFDAAYTANYGELDMALWEVVQANRFLSLQDILSLSTEQE